MKAMIFAAGRGERMGELTRATPKPLLEIAGKPLIEHTLLRLRDGGIEEVVINLAYLGDKIRNHLQDGSRLGLHIVYSQEPHPLETGGGLSLALPLLGSAPFLVVNSDIWTDYPFAQLIDKPLPTGDLGHLVMVPNPSHHPTGDFYLSDAGRLTLNPEQFPASAELPKLTYSGISVLDPALIASYPERRSQFPLVETLQRAMVHNQLGGECYQGFWQDIGTPERLASLKARMGEPAPAEPATIAAT